MTFQANTFFNIFRSFRSRDSKPHQNGDSRPSFGGRGGGRFGSGGGGGGRFGGNSGGRFGGRGGSMNGGGGFKNKQLGSNLTKPNWDLDSLSSFAKDFYNPHPNVVNRPFHEVQQYLASKEITIKGRAPKPIQFFEEANFPDYVMDEVR